MIVSYKWGFIFIRTHKTASKSMEMMLARHCGENDIVTPRGPTDSNGPAQRYRGLFNPLSDIRKESESARSILRRFRQGMRYYNHMSAGQVRRRVGEETWNSFYKFCFERNPWDKVVSHYWYRKKNPRKSPIGSFTEYVEARRCPVDHPLYIIGGELAVDTVGRYENLEADWRSILSTIGLPAQTLSERANTRQRSNSEPYQSYYDQRTRRIVAEIYSREIAMFGYQFDG